jgi:hypothetical protein
MRTTYELPTSLRHSSSVAASRTPAQKAASATAAEERRLRSGDGADRNARRIHRDGQ